jgi:GNAT superfamily N-acetyltransferase
VSDLDLSVIVTPALSTSQQQTLNELANDICQRHACISKLEFDVGDYEEAMVRNEYAWQFWLKHLCVCVYGEDLRAGIQPYRPSLAVGLEMNKDTESRLNKAMAEMRASNYLPIGKSIAKKLLRAQYSLVCEEDSSYFDDLEEIARILTRFDPKHKQEISELLAIAKGNDFSLPVIQGLIDSYGRAVVKNIRELTSKVADKAGEQMITFNPATIEQADLLSNIAVEAKGHWGYSREQLEIWRSGLRIEPDYIQKHTVGTVELGGEVVGFFAITQGETDMLDHLWLMPHVIGKGVGQRAFTEIVRVCCELGIKEFIIISDPDAEGFYLHQGATRVGEVKSVPQKRMLPKLKFVV